MTSANSVVAIHSSADGGPRDRILAVLDAPETYIGESPVSHEQLQAAVKLSESVFETALEQLVQDGRVRYIPSEGYARVGDTPSQDQQCAICSEPIESEPYTELSIETHNAETTVSSHYDAHRSCITPVLDLVDEFDYPHRD
ncbi:MAG: hypothetical protein ABEI76_08480 [Halobacteriales archaeon]